MTQAEARKAFIYGAKTRTGYTDYLFSLNEEVSIWAFPICTSVLCPGPAPKLKNA